MQQQNRKEHTIVDRHFAAIKANEEVALAKLYGENYLKVELYILNNNGTPEDAKDIFQEAFIAMWRNIQLDKFYPENEDALNGYLYRIAKNKWLDHLRSAHYKKMTRIDGSADHLPEILVSEEDGRYLAQVKDKFQSLGGNCREILKRFYYQKESMRVIASDFKWTEATAKNNKYRCLQRLRDLIKKENS